MGNQPTIVVVRHGITPHNQMINGKPPAKLEKLLEGAVAKGASETDLIELLSTILKRNRQADEEVPLNSRGKGQCVYVKQWLEEEGYTFKHCLSSPYKRARDSARIIATGHVTRTTYEQLCERDLGVFHDLPRELFHKFFPREARLKEANPLDWQPAGGQTLRSRLSGLRSVVKSAIERIRNGEHVLIVAHADTNIGLRASPELGNMIGSLHRKGPGAWNPLWVQNGQTDLYQCGGPEKSSTTKPAFFRSVVLPAVTEDDGAIDTGWKMILR